MERDYWGLGFMYICPSCSGGTRWVAGAMSSREEGEEREEKSGGEERREGEEREK